MPNPIEFETDRLRLRQWRDDDLEPFAALNADPRVMEFLPKQLDRRESDELARRIRSRIEQRGWGLWAVEVKGGKPFIGYVGLSVPVATLLFSPCIEIGWRLAFDHWGQGYASEAARGVLRVAFDRLELPEIVSFTAIVNNRSCRVMKRIGMQYSGEFGHPSLSEDNPLRPHVLYRLRGEQWDGDL